MRTRRTTLISALLVVAALSGVVGRAVQAGALGNQYFKYVNVQTTPTTATIRFDSWIIGPIWVTVGTGLDPTTSKVGEVKLAHSDTHRYKAVFGGLKPNHGYSFRIAGMAVTPYTDITSLVTKPPYFRNILPSVQYVRGSIDFDYDGVGPVTVTLSKSFDFTTHYYRRKVLSGPTWGAHWQAVFTDMDAGTAYAFQLKAPDAPNTYVDITSLVTKHRNVSLVYRYFYAKDDGDAWPYGCGDFYLSHQEQGDFDSNYWMLMFAYQCVDSGHGLDLTQSGMAYRNFTDVKDTFFLTNFWAFDDDQKIGDPDCYPDYVSNTCGDVAYGHAYVDISTPGVHTFSIHALGIQNSLDVTASGDVTVTFY